MIFLKSRIQGLRKFQVVLLKSVINFLVIFWSFFDHWLLNSYYLLKRSVIFFIFQQVICKFIKKSGIFLLWKTYPITKLQLRLRGSTADLPTTIKWKSLRAVSATSRYDGLIGSMGRHFKNWKTPFCFTLKALFILEILFVFFPYQSCYCRN